MNTLSSLVVFFTLKKLRRAGIPAESHSLEYAYDDIRFFASLVANSNVERVLTGLRFLVCVERVCVSKKEERARRESG